MQEEWQRKLDEWKQSETEHKRKLDEWRLLEHKQNELKIGWQRREKEWQKAEKVKSNKSVNLQSRIYTLQSITCNRLVVQQDGMVEGSEGASVPRVSQCLLELCAPMLSTSPN